MPKKTKSNRISNEVCRELKALRNAANLSQSELAARLGCSYQQIGKYERGESRISHDRYLKIREICLSRERFGRGFQEDAVPFGAEFAFREELKTRAAAINSAAADLCKFIDRRLEGF